MRRIVCWVVWGVLVIGRVNAQNNNQLSFHFSPAQMEMEYQHQMVARNMWGGVFAGVGNQDVNRSFDDLLAGGRLGIELFSNVKNSIGVYANMGIYIPNNDYYTAETPVVGLGARYQRFIGRKKRHCVLVSAGYRYGKRDYKQMYSSEIIKVATIDEFRIAPFFFSLGYGLNF